MDGTRKFRQLCTTTLGDPFSPEFFSQQQRQLGALKTQEKETDKAWRVRKSYVEEVTIELSFCGCVGFELKKRKSG